MTDCITIAAKGTETRWRKKPVEVEAFKWEGKLVGNDGVPNVPNWAWDAYKDGTIFFSSIHAEGPNDEMFIHTLEGNHHASIGDYVIRGVKGEIYPCKPDIFAQTYEPVERREGGIYIPNTDIPAPGEAFYFVQDRETGEVLIQVGSTDKELKVVSVPPHGKLGDLDALLKQCEFVCTDEYEDVRAVRYDVIEAAPTIIPADEAHT